MLICTYTAQTPLHSDIPFCNISDRRPRYDAEETATKPPLEESLPPADEPISTANGDALETQKQPPDIPPSVENGRNTAQNGHFDADYGNSDMYEAQVNDYPHGDMDTEHRNVGIKEDG